VFCLQEQAKRENAGIFFKKESLSVRSMQGISVYSRLRNRKKGVIKKMLRTENYSEICNPGKLWDQSPFH
jgi:hypothetical protein